MNPDYSSNDRNKGFQKPPQGQAYSGGMQPYNSSSGNEEENPRAGFGSGTGNGAGYGGSGSGNIGQPSNTANNKGVDPQRMMEEYKRGNYRAFDQLQGYDKGKIMADLMDANGDPKKMQELGLLNRQDFDRRYKLSECTWRFIQLRHRIQQEQRIGVSSKSGSDGFIQASGEYTDLT